jgi:hypothetical protein
MTPTAKAKAHELPVCTVAHQAMRSKIPNRRVIGVPRKTSEVFKTSEAWSKKKTLEQDLDVDFLASRVVRPWRWCFIIEIHSLKC